MLRMKPTARIALTALFALSLTACSQKVEDTHPDQPVTKRQEAFKAMLRAFEPMGVMLRDEVYQAEPFAAMAERFDDLRDTPWAHFGPGTDYRPSKSKPAVWSREDDCARERERFIAASAALREAALSHDEGRIRPAYQAVYDSCRDCHRGFRK